MVLAESDEVVEPKPAVTETALLMVLEKFFEVVLNLPTVNRYFVKSLQVNFYICSYQCQVGVWLRFSF